MNQFTKADIILAVTLFIVLMLQFIKYKFPHFGMHILKPSNFNQLDLDSFDFDSCKHTKEEIQDYKRIQLIWLLVVIAVVVFVISLYIKSKYGA